MSGYKLILVPEENVRTHSPSWDFPYVTVSQDVMYEVIADVGEDHKVRMSRYAYDNIEVIDPEKI